MTLLRTSLCLLFPALLLACGGDEFVEGNGAGGVAGSSAGGSGGSSAGSSAGGASSGQGGASGAGQAGDAGAGQAGDGGSGQAGDAGNAGNTAAGASGEAGQGGAGGDAGAAQAGAAGDGGSGQAGDAGQGGDAGAAQAGAAGDGGSGQAGDGGSGQAGDAGSGQAGDAGQGGGGQGGAGNGGANQGGAGQGGSGGGPTGDTVYVSSQTGSDSNSGFAHDQPKKTLAAAVALATGTAGVKEIKLCRGEYEVKQTIELPAGLSMTGGYECATFTNPTVYTPQNYCAGTVDPALLTTLHGSATPLLRLLSGSGTTVLRGLDLLAQQIGVEMQNSSALMEKNRIAVDPAATAAGPSGALLIYGGSPQIRESCIKGGPGKTTVDAGQLSLPASVGVGLQDGSTATLALNEIEGGFGDGNDKGLGSIGVLARNASPIIKNNRIQGGAGISSKRTASTGIFIHSTPGSATPCTPDIKNNSLIDGGTGANAGGGRGSTGLALFCDDTGGPCAGVNVSGERTISGNTIQGGKGRSTGTPSSAVQSGVSFYGGGNFENVSKIDLVDNRITGGSTNGGQPSTKPGPVAVSFVYARGKVERNSILGGQFNADSSIGMTLSLSKNLRIVNNMIHSGILSAGTTSLLQGIAFSSVQQLIISHNTLLMGSGAAIGRGISMWKDSGNVYATSEVRIDNNLILGNKDPHYGIEFADCPAGRVTSLQGNGFANLEGRSFFLNFSDNASCGGGGKVLDAAGYQQALGTYCENASSNCGLLTAQLQGNIEINAGCPGNTGCAALPACLSYNTCAGALFDVDDPSDQNLANALIVGANKGWKLRGALPCGIHRTPASLPDITTDFYNAARKPDQYSRGAHQQNVCFGGN